MSILGRQVSIRAAAIGVAVVLVFAALLPASSTTPTREITLVAKGMAFYLEGSPDTPNPTIHVKAGERVRVVLRNEDRGMKHDFALPALAVAMKLVDWSDRGDVAFEAPAAPGAYEYVCQPHSLMMRGTIQVD